MTVRIGPTTVIDTAAALALAAHANANGTSHSLVKDATTSSTHLNVSLTAPLGGITDGLNGDHAKNFVPESIIVTVTDVDFPAFLVGGAATPFGVAWTGVADGEFDFTIDGAALAVTGCDFSLCADMDAVAAVIQTRIRAAAGASGTEVCTWDTDHFVITSGSTDVAVSAVSVLATPAAPAGTDISGAGATFMAGTLATGAVLHPVPTMDGEITVGIDGGTGTEIKGSTALTGLYLLGQTSAIPAKSPFPDIAGDATLIVTSAVADSTSINLKVRVDVTGRQW